MPIFTRGSSTGLIMRATEGENYHRVGTKLPPLLATTLLAAVDVPNPATFPPSFLLTIPPSDHLFTLHFHQVLEAGSTSNSLLPLPLS